MTRRRVRREGLAGRMRRWRRLAALGAAVLICVPPHLLFTALRRPSPMPRLFLRLAARACGVRIRIAGQPLRLDVLHLANHVSWLDILALGGATGGAFISKDDVAGWPVAGWMARQNHTIFVARERRAIAGQIAALRDAFAAHRPIILFPEGTTGNGRTLLPFKPALLAGLLPPPRPLHIQPVAIDYGPAAPDIAWFDEEPMGANVTRLLARKGPLDVTLRFLAPLAPDASVHRKALAATAHVRIADALGVPAPGASIGDGAGAEARL